MPSRPVRPRTLRSSVIGSLAAVLAIAVIGGPAQVVFAGSPTDCLVTNTSRPAPRPTYPDLAGAVADATAGEKLTLRGLCQTGEIVIDKKLSITGTRRTSPDSGKPTLSGSLTTGRLLLIKGAAVTITGLRLTGGEVSGGIPDGYGGGILVDGGTVAASVVLKDSTVQGNTAKVGGGVAGIGDVTVTLSGSTRVKGNAGTDAAGGVYLEGGLLVLKDSAGITGNDGAADGSGGGVYGNRGRITMGGTSRISGNIAYVGAGLYLYGTSLTMSGSAQIAANTGRWGPALTYDGGLDATIRLKGQAVITKNVVTGAYSSVVALLNDGPGKTVALVMEDSAAITQNDARSQKGTATILIRQGATSTITVTMTESSRVKLNKAGAGAATWLYPTACGTAPTLTGVKTRTVDNQPASPKILASSSTDYC